MSLTIHTNRRLSFGTVDTGGKSPLIHLIFSGSSTIILANPLEGEFSFGGNDVICNTESFSEFFESERSVLLPLITNFAEQLKIIWERLPAFASGIDVIHGHQDEARFMGGIEIKVWLIAPGAFQSEQDSNVSTAHALLLTPQQGHSLTGHLYSVELVSDVVSPVNLLVASSVVFCPLFNELVWLNNIGQHIFKGLHPKNFDPSVSQRHDLSICNVQFPPHRLSSLPLSSYRV